ncbi:MAG: uracil-DNA glycosylase [Acidimicrobiia bacterium]|jgi:uracil-DNA glycosylase
MTVPIGLDRLNADLVACRRCPRLVDWREQVALERRAAFRHEEYWGKPVPGFGDPGGRLVVVGLAPAAHGANRTGRMFTGDRSGEWLYRALHRAGFASQSQSTGCHDGLRLTDCYVTAVVRCAPPANRPAAAEVSSCTDWLVAELRLLAGATVLVALGGLAFDALVRLAPRLGWTAPRPRPSFGHGVEVEIQGGPRLLAGYHPSQQNTFTGRLTEPMLDAVFARARAILGEGGGRFPLRG